MEKIHTQSITRAVNDIDIFDVKKQRNKLSFAQYDWLHFIYLILKKGPSFQITVRVCIWIDALRK